MAADVPAKRVPSGAAVFREGLTDKILHVAVGELADKGLGRFSMDAVARICGVGKSALYRRWRNKEDLIVAAVSQFSVPLTIDMLRPCSRIRCDRGDSWRDTHLVTRV